MSDYVSISALLACDKTPNIKTPMERSKRNIVKPYIKVDCPSGGIVLNLHQQRSVEETVSVASLVNAVD